MKLTFLKSLIFSPAEQICRFSNFVQVVDMYRRIIFVGVIPLLGKGSSTRAYVGAALSLISTIYFREMNPFRSEYKY